MADIADVRFGTKEPVATIRVLGESALVARAIREIGANVIETMDGIRAAVDEMNAQAREDTIRYAQTDLEVALERLKADGRHPVRDSDVKRRILEIDAQSLLRSPNSVPTSSTKTLSGGENILF